MYKPQIASHSQQHDEISHCPVPSHPGHRSSLCSTYPYVCYPFIHQSSMLSAPDIQLSTSTWIEDPESPQADDFPSDVLSEGQQQPIATSQCLCHSSPFNSTCRHKKCEYNIFQERERPISLNFYDSILLQLFYFIPTVINLSLCLVYKLKIIMGMYVQEETVYLGFCTIHGFKHPLGVLQCIPHE